jgi:quinol-cytochrome oxidoreductase complex cytochrome b subunit
LVAVGALALTYLIATGVVLSVRYEPEPGDALRDANFDTDQPFVRSSHRVVGLVAAIDLLAIACWSLVGALRTYRPALGFAGIGIAVLGVVAYRTGLDLAWDNIRAIRNLDDPPRGLRPLFQPGVLSAIVDDRELSLTRMRVSASLHVIVAPLGLIGLAIFALGRSRRGDAEH